MAFAAPSRAVAGRTGLQVPPRSPQRESSRNGGTGGTHGAVSTVRSPRGNVVRPAAAAVVAPRGPFRPALRAQPVSSRRPVSPRLAPNPRSAVTATAAGTRAASSSAAQHPVSPRLAHNVRSAVAATAAEAQAASSNDSQRVASTPREPRAASSSDAQRTESTPLERMNALSARRRAPASAAPAQGSVGRPRALTSHAADVTGHSAQSSDTRTRAQTAHVIDGDEALARQLADEEAGNLGQSDMELAMALAREFEAAAEMMPGGGIPALSERTERSFMSQVTDRPASPSAAQLQRLPTHSAGPRELDEECPVCFASYEEGDQLKTLPCLHAFHTECIDKWLTSCRKSALCCPICNTEVDI